MNRGLGAIGRALALALGLLLLAAAARVAWEFRDEPLVPGPVRQADPALIARGEQLARAGNCIGCHTARGGVPYAGGAALLTPFGTIYSSNLTPEVSSGLGAWNAAEFWRAMHHGRSRDGRLLYPAFPYPNITRVTREDSDALFAFLRSLPPVSQPRHANALRFPYDTQLALAAWRAMFFRPARFEPDPARSASWNRGAYLVQGLGHCNACHARRNALGATASAVDLSGGMIPMQNWYAPSLTGADEAGVADWDAADVVALLKTGISRRGSAIGPMGEVVLTSTQHLPEAELRAMAEYLQSLPATKRPASDPAPAGGAALARGEKLYADHCARCHGDRGEGALPAYPPLAGNRAVTMDPPANLVRVALGGGFPPATAGNPRPYGMPPFATVLGDEDLAALLSYLRSAWGHRASALTATDINRYRGSQRP